MRVLTVSRFTDPTAELATLRALASLGVEPTVLVPDLRDPHARDNFSTDGGVRILPVHAKGLRADPTTLQWSRRAIRRALREWRPELLQLTDEFWCPVAAVMAGEARRAHLPLAGFARAAWPERLPLRTGRRARRVLDSTAAAAATSVLAAGPLRALRPGLHLAVGPYPGVALPPSPVRTSSSALTIGVVSRLTDQHGVDILLQALAQLPHAWQLRISGTGPAQVDLEMLAERLGVAARIQWLGAQPRRQRVELYAELDLVVAPHLEFASPGEFSGVALMQAAAHGIPVVATDTGIVPELVGQSGLLVPPGDIEALAAAIGALASDPGRRLELGDTGRRRAQQEFSHDAVARRMLTLWQAQKPVAVTV